MTPPPRNRLRRLAPLAVLLVPLIVVAALVAVDQVRGDHDTRALSPRGESGALPGVTTPAPAPTLTPTFTPAPAQGACPASGLSVRLGAQDAAMGLRVLGIDVVNCGAVPRTLYGHPVIRLLDEDRQPLDVLVSQGSSGIATVPSFDAAPRRVTLQPGERAGTAVMWRNLVTDPSVRATEGEFLEVSVAAGDPPQVIDAEGGIDLGNTGKLAVAPWSARPPTR